MKITIDTKEDSPAEIRKAIQLLHSLAQNNQSQNNLFEPTPILETPEQKDDSWNVPQTQPTPEPAKSAPAGFMNMFAEVEPVKEEKKEDSDWDDKDKPGLMTY